MQPAKPTTSTAVGRTAETLAAEYLSSLGFAILDRNWRNRWCELDIVARRASIIHFIEVKYRGRTTWGTGFDYISYDKSQRLRRAALAWVQAHSYQGNYQIDVVCVTGPLDQPQIDYLANAIGD